MVTRQMGVVDVQQREDFDDLLRSLEESSNSVLTVDVLSDADVLSEPAEFEALLDAARLNGVELELATDDPIRQELGRIYGMRIVTGSTITPAWVPSDDATTVRLPGASSDKPSTSAPEVDLDDDETAPLALTPARSSPFDTDASFSFVLAPPDIRQPAQPVPAAPRSRRRRQHRSVSRSVGSGSLVVSGLVIVAAIAILLTALLAPSAAVVVVPETRAVSAAITYGIAGSEQTLDIEIAPTVISETLVFEATAPATGEQTIPDAAARGMVFLTNPFSEVVALPAGTTITSPEFGVSYETLEHIDIPAADPFESARFGTAAVGIRALEAGPAGNLDVGQLSGVHETGIMFQNRFPIDGGTEISVRVVSEEDIESLTSTARQDLDARAPNTFDGDLEPGWSLIGELRILGDVAADLSAEAGEQVDEVSITARLDVEGEVYDSAALEAQARDSLQQQLASQVPEGFGLDMESVRLSSPRAIEGSDRPGFRLDAQGNAAAHFDSDDIERLSDEFTGHGERHAAEVLESTAGVNSYSLTYGPSWLPWEPIPRFSNRVSVDISGT